MVTVDVAVVGGGFQGLVLLRELTSAGYGSVLITNADLGRGQTLHSHGLLNSGTGLLTGALQQELCEFTLPYLRRLGLALYGEDRSFLLAPAAVVGQLAPVWEANQYHPQRTDPSGLPAGVEAAGQGVYRVPGVSVDKRSLVGALSAGLEPLVLRGEVVEAGQTIRVRAEASGDVVSLEARAVVVAAGCGTKRLLRRAFAADEVAFERIAYTKVHMISLRAPRGVLPDVGTVMSPELLIAAHPTHESSTSETGLVTWYVTPGNPDPPRFAEAPDDAAANVDQAVVRTGIEALLRVIPRLSRPDERIQATVFAGYKQDFDGQPTRRACEVVDGERNVIMALPSVLANAVPNAVEALTLIRHRLKGTATAPELPSGASVAVGQLNENLHPTRWMSWRDFAEAHGMALG